MYGTAKREWFTLIGIYFAAHLPLLLTTGLFLDSWTIVHGDRSLNVAYLWITGRPLMGYFLNAALSFENHLVPRLITFCMYLAAGLLVYRTLRYIKEIDSIERFLIASIFMVYPVDTGRVSMIRSYSATCYAAFFLGFWLLAKYLASRNIFYRLLALLSFWYAFWINSFLVLYGLALLFIAYQERRKLKTVSGVLSQVCKYLDFICLPVIFWTVQKTVFASRGIYANYNANRFDSISNIIGYLAEIVYSFDGGFLQVLQYAVTPPGAWYVIGILVEACLLYLVLKERVQQLDYQKKKDLTWFLAGWFFMAVALFPYYYVGKIPTETDWASRFSQTVPLGAAFILFYGFKLVGNFCRLPVLRIGSVALLLIAVLVCANTKSYFEYWNDWYKCRSTIRAFKDEECFTRYRSFLFRDNARDLNAKHRFLRFYEMTGLLKLAFDEEDRFAYYLDYHDDEKFQQVLGMINGEKNDPPIPEYSKLYVVRDWNQQPPQAIFQIDPLRERLGPGELIRLKFIELAFPDKFEQKLPAYVAVRCAAIPDGMTFPVEKDPSMVSPPKARYSWPVNLLLKSLGRT